MLRRPAPLWRWAVIMTKRPNQSPASGGAVSDLLADVPDPLGTAENCWCAAVSLFHEIKKRLGTAEAERIFAALGAPSARRRSKFQNVMLWSAYEIGLTQGWSVKRIARHIAEQNSRSLPEDRIGPRGGQSAEALEKQIHRLKDQHRRRG
jgi:hypothetical protein